jgi:hypothetical protein
MDVIVVIIHTAGSTPLDKLTVIIHTAGSTPLDKLTEIIIDTAGRKP